MIFVKTFDAPPVDKIEILRYASTKQEDLATSKLVDEVLDEVFGSLSYKACYMKLPVNFYDDLCDFGLFQVKSSDLSKALLGCSKVLLFGATIGIGIDRAIAKYGHISPAKALICQAIGAERIEALCDTFVSSYESENNVALTRRFSPGYGDLPLDVQKNIFDILNCPAKIGLSITDTLLMSPSKSVTAFAGICK